MKFRAHEGSTIMKYCISNNATESIKINPDGTKDIKYITQFPDE